MEKIEFKWLEATAPRSPATAVQIQLEQDEGGCYGGMKGTKATFIYDERQARSCHLLVQKSSISTEFQQIRSY